MLGAPLTSKPDRVERKRVAGLGGTHRERLELWTEPLWTSFPPLAKPLTLVPPPAAGPPPPTSDTDEEHRGAKWHGISGLRLKVWLTMPVGVVSSADLIG
jgi:hypothetical protein